jgi:hypothetical protein
MTTQTIERSDLAEPRRVPCVDVPIPHDLPYPICAECGFPIPAYDLGGNEFQPLHASTCASTGPAGA